jgi:hypothetical protein
LSVWLISVKETSTATKQLDFEFSVRIFYFLGFCGFLGGGGEGWGWDGFGFLGVV